MWTSGADKFVSEAMNLNNSSIYFLIHVVFFYIQNRKHVSTDEKPRPKLANAWPLRRRVHVAITASQVRTQRLFPVG